MNNKLALYLNLGYTYIHVAKYNGLHPFIYMYVEILISTYKHVCITLKQTVHSVASSSLHDFIDDSLVNCCTAAQEQQYLWFC